MDCRRFLGLVVELTERFGLEVHVSVLMDNHYHLLVRARKVPPLPGLGTFLSRGPAAHAAG